MPKIGPFERKYREDPVKFKEMVRAMIVSDELLIKAVKTTDVDWCIKRLREVQRAKGDIQPICQLVLDSLDDELKGKK